MDSQSALKQLTDYRANTQGAGDIYKQQSQELGVGASQQRAQELRNLVSGTEQALRGVESSVTGRTQGSLVTEAQRSRLANIERAPLSDQFNTQQNALSGEQQTYQNLLGEANTRTGLLYGSQQDRLKSFESDYQQALAQEAQSRQEAEQKRQFDLELAQSRVAAQKNTYDIQSIIDQILGKNVPIAPAVPKVLSATAIPRIAIDTSKGLDVNKAIASGGLSTASKPAKAKQPVTAGRYLRNIR